LRTRPLHSAKRWLFLVHRWVSIGVGLLFVIWFVSGVVMVYVPFPALTHTENLKGQEPIAWARLRVQPETALRIANPAGATQSIMLEMQNGKPVWRIKPYEGGETTLSAESGLRLSATTERQAQQTALAFSKQVRAQSVRLVDRDQWTVAGGYDQRRPFWKVVLDDSAGTELYVSVRTGAVALDTRRSERFWNWLGSVPHWIYLTALRQNQPLWRQVIIWVSGISILTALSGIWIGILRLRVRRPYSQNRMIPYRDFWHKWHHVTGLIGGITLTTWIISGWLSVDPGRLFNTGGLSDEGRTAYAQAGIAPTILPGKIVSGVKRLQLIWIAGKCFWLTEGLAADAVLLDPQNYQETRPSAALISAAANHLVSGAKVAGLDTLTQEDAYYYDGTAAATLPVLRYRFADTAQTWVHIDPRTGEILGSIDERGRTYRWLFDLLHKWDFEALTTRRPLWDGLIWLLSLIGLASSVTGVVIGWKRLKR
jgi:uncharacterized iron-regulated membrane protein